MRAITTSRCLAEIRVIVKTRTPYRYWEYLSFFAIVLPQTDRSVSIIDLDLNLYLKVERYDPLCYGRYVGMDSGVLFLNSCEQDRASRDRG